MSRRPPERTRDRAVRWAGALRGLTRREPGLLVLLLVVVAGGWGFAELADAVMDKETRQWDEAVLWALYEGRNPPDPIGPDWLEDAASNITALGSLSVLGLMSAVVLGYLLIRRHWPAVLLVLIAVGGGTILVFVLKGAFERQRPALTPHLVEVSTYSFPSAHAMLSAVVYITLGTMLARLEPARRLKWYYLSVALGLALVIGVSRVYAGVHYPSDVVAGWSAGLAWAALCWLGAALLERGGWVRRR